LNYIKSIMYDPVKSKLSIQYVGENERWAMIVLCKFLYKSAVRH
jgi:hypothetical protein